MSLALLAGIGVLGGFGAIARVLLDGAVTAIVRRPFPWGILVVNLTGAFALGVLTGATVSTDALRLVGTGFLGAYTTFSTWMVQTHRLAETGHRRAAALNVLVSLAAGVLCAWLGRELGMAL